MRIPLLHTDFEQGSYTKVAKALRKIWPQIPLSLMQAQDSLAILLGYNGHFDARREASAAFSHPPGSIGMNEASSAVVRRMFLKFGIDPLAARELVPRLHLNELAFAADSRVGEIFRGIFRQIDAALAHGSGVAEPTDGSTARLFFDESALLLGSMAEPMKERLRSVEGIPNATYQIRGDRVFVFEKLIKHVEALGFGEDDAEFATIARMLVENATASPDDAVARWKIVPAPFEIEEIGQGKVAIRHKPFNARIPGVYNSRTEAQPALVELLMGRVVPGVGDFEYQNQPLTLRAPLDLKRFTASPPEVDVATPAEYRGRLHGIEWRPGFDPVPEGFFVKARDVCAQWSNACDAMGTWVDQNIAGIWARVAELNLDALNDPRDVVPEREGEQMDGLRRCYPELTMLSDGTLWEMYDHYQLVCWQANSWDARRDDDLVFFLMGRLTAPAVDGYARIPVGRWAVYQWMRGGSLEAAKTFAREIHFNSHLASDLGSRLADAMQFLVHSAQAEDLRGEKISTFGDLFRLGRKRSAVPVLMQSPPLPHGPSRRNGR